MSKPKHLNNKDPWMLGEEIPDLDFLFSQIWLSNFVNEFSRFTGRAYKKIMCIYRGYHLWFYYGERDSYEVGQNIVDKMVKNPKFAAEVNKNILLWADNLRAYVEKLPQENLKRFSNQQLMEFFAGHDKTHTDYYCWAWIPVAADMFHNNLTNCLKKYLQKIGTVEEKINEYLVILTQPTKKSLIQIEQEEFIKIGQAVQKDKNQFKIFLELFKKFKEKEAAKFGFKTHSKEYEDLFEQKVSAIGDKISPVILKMIQSHYLKYFYMKYLYTENQGVYSFDHYLKELVRLVSSGDLKKKMREMQAEFLAAAKKRQALIKKLKLRGSWKILFDAFGDFMVTKIYRRYAQIYAIYRMEAIMREIGKRLGLTLMQAKYMLPQEIYRALVLKEKFDHKIMKSRTKFCVYYATRGNDLVLIGEQAEKLANQVQVKKHEKVKEIQGQCGCVGKAKGRVKIINSPRDMQKMKQGDILVSIATNPDLVPAMKKAAAIVTEQGGVTSHAAITAREMRIPCVIGTKIATKVLRDGDRVEVDASAGVVKKIR